MNGSTITAEEIFLKNLTDIISPFRCSSCHGYGCDGAAIHNKELIKFIAEQLKVKAMTKGERYETTMGSHTYEEGDNPDCDDCREILENEARLCREPTCQLERDHDGECSNEVAA